MNTKLLKKIIAFVSFVTLSLSLVACGDSVKFENDDVGTYYKKDDGSYATNEWIQKKNDWYYFDGNGYMIKSGFTPDFYYLDDQGKLIKDKWVQDKNKLWYYINNEGQMLRNATTPDGCYVGPDGVYIDERFRNIINNIDRRYIVGNRWHNSGNVITYEGYQLYDADNDGENELYIFRKVETRDKKYYKMDALGNMERKVPIEYESVNRNVFEIFSKKHIHEAYKIENDEVIQFIKCNAGSCCGVELEENFNSRFIDHYNTGSKSLGVVKVEPDVYHKYGDIKFNNHYLCYSYESYGQYYHYSMDGKEMKEDEYINKFNEVAAELGYFPVDVRQ